MLICSVPAGIIQPLDSLFVQEKIRW